MKDLIIFLVAFVVGYAGGEVFLYLLINKKLSWKWLAVLVLAFAGLVFLT